MTKQRSELSYSQDIKNALSGGVVASLIFAGMNVLGIVLLLATNKMPSTGEAITDTTAAIIGIVVEAGFGLLTAWRFKVGKGLVFGSLLVALFSVEVFMKVVSGTTNGGWFFFYAALFIGLINGVRGAWAARRASKTAASAPN